MLPLTEVVSLQECEAMKAMLATIFFISVSLTVAAQSHEPTPFEIPAHVDLNATLTDADRVVAATNTDLANLHVEKWSAGWKTAWTKKSSHKQQAGQTADSVKQLASSLSPRVAEVRASHGSVGSAFKLYNDLTMVCENLDTLVEATHAYGKKDEYTRLAADYSNMLRVRNNFSSYVEQRAQVVDPRGNVTTAAAAPPSIKKEHTAKKMVAKRKKPVLVSSN